MASAPTPQLLQYRITLFYGPEPVDGRSSRVHCVFNVKKRSWKGGIQVVVEVDEAQLACTRQAIGLDGWAKTALEKLPEAERQEAEHRLPDLFVQAVCAIKLDLAVGVGLPQESHTIGAGVFTAELDCAVKEQRDRITGYLRTELDLPD